MLNESIIYFSAKDAVLSVFSLFSVSSTIIGTLLGVFAGYFLSDMQLRKQRYEQMKSIATGFYYEITEIEKTIDPILINENPDSHFDMYKLYQIIGTKEVNLDRFKIYDHLGLYFHFRKEIYMFNKHMVKDFILFYNSLLSAEESYRMYRNLLFNGKMQGTNVYDAQDKVFACLHEAQKAGMDLKEHIKVYVTVDN